MASATLEAITQALGGRRCGRGYIARCPAHDDRSPSLSIREHGGKILVHCHAGCPQPDVIAELRARGLWPQEERIQRSPPDRKRLAREWAEVERVRAEAAYFADAAAMMAEWALEELSPVHPERALHTARLAALRVSPEAEYRVWLSRNPSWAAALVHAGRERERRLARMILAYITAELHDAP
jgi:hypothetical protein